MVSSGAGISKNKREITVRVLWNVVMPERSSEARASRQGENAPVYKNLTRFFFGGEWVRVAVGSGEDVRRGSMARVSRTWKNAPANTSYLYGAVGCGQGVSRSSMARVSKTGRTRQPSLDLMVTMKLIADSHLVQRRGEEVLKEKAGFYKEFLQIL